jgi:hypothetical protein
MYNMRKTKNKWYTKECAECKEPHYNFTGKLDKDNIEYVVCPTNRRSDVINSGTLWKKQEDSIQVELNKQDLVRLVTAYNPHRNLVNKFSNLKYGRWVEKPINAWRWNKDILEQLSEEQLYNIFLERQASWSNKTLNV